MQGHFHVIKPDGSPLLLLRRLNSKKKTKGMITMAVPEDCWLWPYIEYEVEYDNETIIVDGYDYENENYHNRGFIRPISDFA